MLTIIIVCHLFSFVGTGWYQRCASPSNSMMLCVLLSIFCSLMS